MLLWVSARVSQSSPGQTLDGEWRLTIFHSCGFLTAAMKTAEITRHKAVVSGAEKPPSTWKGEFFAGTYVVPCCKMLILLELSFSLRRNLQERGYQGYQQGCQCRRVSISTARLALCHRPLLIKVPSSLFAASDNAQTGDQEWDSPV